MATDKEKSESLDIILTEQHRDFDYLLHIYNRMRAGQSILLAASFAVVAYLYSSQSSDDLSIAERLFFPGEGYGQVIYVIAAGFFLFGTIKLMINVFGYHPWETAYVTDKDNYSYIPLETKVYFKERNDSCIKRNGESYNKHKVELIFLFYSVTISAIILIVTKTLS